MDMVLFARSNTSAMSEADIVIIGVPDESKSHAKRKGTRNGPDVLRMASHESEFFERADNRIPILPMRGTFDGKRIHDLGNVDRADLCDLVSKVISNKKLPIIIGGDHSVTTEALRAASREFGKVGLVYFDAHPDFVSSTKDYYGSVLSDSRHSLDFKKSLPIGTRAAEPEELENARKAGLKVVTPVDIAEKGVLQVSRHIKSRTRGIRKYISIDLDCLDPSFAPGVSVPSACGLGSVELVYLVKEVISTGMIAGIDIVELSPDFDIGGITAHLAAKILSECIASVNL